MTAQYRSKTLMTNEPEKTVVGPTSFIVGPYEKCAMCGAEDAFGLLSVGRYSYAKRCRECLEDRTFELPVLDKRMIYLDQHVISNLAKSLHPDSKHKYELDKPATHFGFWPGLFAKLDRLNKLQLAVCPTAPVQRTESLMDDRLTKQLDLVSEHLSGEVSFRDLDSIRMMQLGEAMESFLTGNPPELDRNQVVYGNLSHWLDKLRITVDMGHEQEERAAARSQRERNTEHLSAYREGILELEQGPSFDVHYASVIDAGLIILDDLMGRNVLARIMERHDVQREKWPETFEEFSRSEQVRLMPQLMMWAALFAAFNVELSEGRSPKEVRPSLYFDFVGISAYLPYCDAFFVDRECARFLDMGRVHGVVPWETRIFTIDTKDEFLAYLDEIEDGAPPGQVELVEKVYGLDWLTPFWEISTWRD